MNESILVLGVGLLAAALAWGCDRGQRIAGVSWFDIAHEMRGTSKKARGRMQQRKGQR